ncbi:MAG: lipopolysaccharide biosynthesis protein [Petrotogales bacterium]
MFKNAYFLMFSSLTHAGSGFFFWLITARFYTAEEVGISSAIISTMALISIFSLFGFDVSLIRFLPRREEKVELINTCFIISFCFSLFLSLIFITLVETLAPSLVIIKENKSLCLLFVIFTVVAPLKGLQTEGIFVGFRKAEYSFFQTIVTIARVGVVPFLIAYGAVGIYGSYGLTPILAFTLGMFFIKRIYPSYKIKMFVKKEVIKDIFHFSSGNYFARVLEMMPHFILPIMVINILGAEKNAYFYIAWQISFLVLAVPRFTSMSLLAEGSYNSEKVRKNLIKATKFILVLLTILILGIFFFGKYILLIFGEDYFKNSFWILVVLSIGSVPFSFNVLYISIKRIQKQVKPLIYVYGLVAVITLSTSYLLMQSMGLIGVGFAWILGNGLVACTIIKKLYTERYNII